MPEVMIRYRAASFFGKLYAPEILNGMGTVEEAYDSGQVDVPPDEPKKSTAETVKAKLKSTAKLEDEKPVSEPAKGENGELEIF